MGLHRGAATHSHCLWTVSVSVSDPGLLHGAVGPARCPRVQCVGVKRAWRMSAPSRCAVPGSPSVPPTSSCSRSPSPPPPPPPSQRPLPPACPGSPLHSAGLCGRPVPPPRPCPRGVGFFTFPSPSLSTLFPCPNPCHRSNVRPRGGPPPGSPPRFPGRACFVFPLNPTPWSLPLPVERGAPSLTPRSWVHW